MSPTVTATGLLPVVFDPDSPDALDVNDGVGYVVHADLSMPPPAAKPQYASSVDTEGSIPVPDSVHYDNREIGITIRVYGDSDLEVEDRLATLYQRLGRIHRQGGVLGVTLPAGRTIFFDLVGEADGDTTFDDRWLRFDKTDIELRLAARPFWRSAEIKVGAGSQTADAPLEIVTEAVPGDVPALGRLVVTDLSGLDQAECAVGTQSRHWTPDASADLFYAASSFTPLGTAAIGGGGVITSTDLGPLYKAILTSAQGLAAAPLTHVGGFRIRAGLLRPTTNSGEVSVRLQYRFGDGLWALGPEVVYGPDEREGAGTVADLGVVDIPDWVDHWEFQILAKSTVLGDDLTVRYVELFPTTEGFIRMSNLSQLDNPASFVALDAFDQTAGGLSGKTLPAGGSWAAISGSDADDFSVSGVGLVTRNNSGDTGGGRWVLATATATTCVVQTDVMLSAAPPPSTLVLLGVLARTASLTNYATVNVYAGGPGVDSQVRFEGVAGGTPLSALVANIAAPTPKVWYTLRVLIDSDGRVLVWYYQRNTTPGTAILAGQYSTFATGGTLASGQAGLHDFSGGSATPVRSYDNFAAWVPGRDAVLFANRSLELGPDRAIRQDVTGSFSSPVAKPEGRYLRLQPGVNRLLVRTLRNDPDTMPNDTFSDTEGDVFATPRGLVIPAA